MKYNLFIDEGIDSEIVDSAMIKTNDLLAETFYPDVIPEILSISEATSWGEADMDIVFCSNISYYDILHLPVDRIHESGIFSGDLCFLVFLDLLIDHQLSDQICSCNSIPGNKNPDIPENSQSLYEALNNVTDYVAFKLVMYIISIFS